MHAAEKANMTQQLRYPPPVSLEHFVLPGAETEFPLTDVQQANLIGRDDSMPLSGGCSCYAEFDWIDLDLARLQGVIDHLVATHTMLRASFVLSPARQRIAPHATLAIELLQLAEGEAAEAAVLRFRESFAQSTLPVDRSPLLRIRALQISPRTTRLFVHVDLLIVDLTSLIRLGALALQEYRTGETTTTAGNFSEYVRWRHWLRGTDAYDQARAYWQERIPGLPPGPDIPVQIPAVARFTNRTYRLDRRRWQAFREHCQAHGVMPSAAILTAYAHVLARWASTAHFTMALPVFDSPPRLLGAENLLGNFTLINLLEIDLRERAPFNRAAQSVHGRIVSDLDRSTYSRLEVIRELARQASGEIFAPYVFTSCLDGARIASRGDEQITMQYCVSRTPQVVLDHQLFEFDEALVLRWDAVEGAFPAGLLDEMWSTYRQVLDHLTSAAAWIAPLTVEPDSIARMWKIYNATGGAYSGAPLHSALARQLRSGRTGDAVVTPTTTVTYPELDRLARAVGHALRAAQTPRGALVPIVMHKGWEQIVAALGILDAGGAYVPIDANLSGQRIRGLLDQVGASTVITQPAYAGSLAELGVPRRIVVERGLAESPSSRVLDVAAAADDVAYVIFTSGSTGTPKGVVVQHGSASNTIEDVCERIGLAATDAAFGVSSLSFDLSVYDIFGVLGGGGRLVLPAPDRLLDPLHWAELAAQHGVTVWNSVPALAQLLLDACRHTGRAAPVRAFLLAGDWIPLSLPPALKRTFSSASSAASVISLGGNTEASIWSSVHDIVGIDPAWRSIPYGRPLRNQRFFVLNERLELAPEGVIGELFIGGAGLAREYLGDAEKTARSFFVHPGLGERVYRTGDFGRMLPSGEIEFLGRRDGQVKLHGNRIELGEVEAALLATPGVTEAVVRLFEPARGGKQLIGYVVCDRAVPPSVVLETARTQLPAYMVPSHVVELARLPLTANGKVNRAALPPPPEEDHASAAETAAEDAAVEARVLELYRQVLDSPTFSNADSFFTFGGDSLRAVQLAIELRKELPACQLSGRDIMLNPTVQGILRCAAEKRSTVGQHDHPS